MTMQSTGSQSFTVYVYMRIAVAEVEQLFNEPLILVKPPVLEQEPMSAVTAPVELKVKLQIDEVPKKETDEKEENGVSSMKNGIVERVSEGKLDQQ